LTPRIPSVLEKGSLVPHIHRPKNLLSRRVPSFPISETDNKTKCITSKFLPPTVPSVDYTSSDEAASHRRTGCLHPRAPTVFPLCRQRKEDGWMQ
jgi:hypothetical protein